MSRFILVLASTLFMLSNVGSAADNPRYRSGNRIHTNEPSVRVGGDNIIFGYEVTGCDLDSLKQAAINLKLRSTTDRWDDKWYALEVPRGECLMIGWYDLNSRNFGWAAAQNQPNTWKARGSRTGWGNLANGNQAKYSFSVNSQKIDLDIFNPNNVGSLGGDDILISFGY